MNPKQLKQKKIKMEIMSTTDTIPRVVNMLYCPCLYVEDSLYAASAKSSLSNSVESPAHFYKHIELALQNYKDGLTYKSITKKDLDKFCNEENSIAYYKKFYNEKSFFPLGNMFLECVDDLKDYGQIIPKTFSYSLM